MKLNNTLSMKRKAGMTLLELTVVILVLLSLISILFIGARAWKKGSDRAGCILNIRNVQQAVRGYMNMHPDLATPPADTDIFSTATGTDGFMKEPTCPSDSTHVYATSYAFDDSVTTPGTIFLKCQIETTDHVPANTETW